MEQSEYILVHVMMGFSTLLPAFLMHFIDVEEPNKLVGYRTKWSMKSAETWKFAQKYSSKMIWWSAAVSISFQLFSIFIFEKQTSILATAGVLTASIFAAIIVTERQLRIRFNQDGSPKRSEREDLI